MSREEADPVRHSVTRIRADTEHQARLKLALHAARIDLERLEPTSTSRRLKIAIEVFTQQVEVWYEEPPSAGTIALIWEHIAEVRDLVRRHGPARTLRRAG